MGNEWHDGDCMIPTPDGRMIVGQTYTQPQQYGPSMDMAVDANGKHYVVCEDDNGNPVFTPIDEWEPADPSGGLYEGDGNFADNH